MGEYISNECMKDFLEGLKFSAHSFSDSDIERIKEAMKFYFGYKED